MSRISLRLLPWNLRSRVCFHTRKLRNHVMQNYECTQRWPQKLHKTKTCMHSLISLSVALLAGQLGWEPLRQFSQLNECWLSMDQFRGILGRDEVPLPPTAGQRGRRSRRRADFAPWVTPGVKGRSHQPRVARQSPGPYLTHYTLPDLTPPLPCKGLKRFVLLFHSTSHYHWNHVNLHCVMCWGPFSVRMKAITH